MARRHPILRRLAILAGALLGVLLLAGGLGLFGEGDLLNRLALRKSLGLVELRGVIEDAGELVETLERFRKQDTTVGVVVRINHPVGSQLKGKIKSITDFGLFVEVEESIDGLVHVSDLHWSKKVKHPSELYKKGDDVEAVVLGIDVDNERISLGIKQLTEDPWSQVPRRYPVGTRVKGAVTSLTDFGAFVELEEGVEGLIHVSQLSNERVDKPSSLFKLGDVVEAEVTNVDSREKRIGLSIKALRKSEERDEMDAYMKRESEGVRFSFADLMSEAEKTKG